MDQTIFHYPSRQARDSCPKSQVDFESINLFHGAVSVGAAYSMPHDGTCVPRECTYAMVVQFIRRKYCSADLVFFAKRKKNMELCTIMSSWHYYYSVR